MTACIEDSWNYRVTRLLWEIDKRTWGVCRVGNQSRTMRFLTLGSLVAISCAAAEPSHAEGAKLLDFHLFGDGRLRYENASLETFENPANGVTVGLRTGLEARIAPRLSLLVEGEAVIAFIDDFNDALSDDPDLPIIADPDNIELNRAQILAELGEQTFLTIGRQNLAIDDQRFIGRAPFRQNMQTFDAIHFSTRTKGGATFQAGFINQVNRALGSRSQLGRFHGDSYFFNANIGTPLGRIGAFHYAFDFETGPESAPNNHFSSRTSGVRYDGRWHADQIGLDVEASYARQTDFADNPFDFSVDYWLAGARAYLGPTRFGFRAETLGANDGEAFQTPAASRHKFQGEADIFVVTPKSGVVDLEASAIWEIGEIGPLSGVSISAHHHWFDAVQGRANLGTEFDLKLAASFHTIKAAFVVADYNAETFAEDTRRIYFSFSKQF